MGSFNWIDIVAILLFVRLGYMGIRLGVGEELTKLAGLLAGIFVGFRWYQDIGDWLAARAFLSREWAAATVLVVLLIVTYLAVVCLLRVIQKAVTLRVVPALDKAGGVVVAAARALLVMSVVLVTLQQLPSEYLQASIQERSASGRYVALAAPAVYDAVVAWVTPRMKP